jgi:hypothetical protein
MSGRLPGFALIDADCAHALAAAFLAPQAFNEARDRRLCFDTPPDQVGTGDVADVATTQAFDFDLTTHADELDDYMPANIVISTTTAMARPALAGPSSTRYAHRTRQIPQPGCRFRPSG